jgi:hypothetical protein
MEHTRNALLPEWLGTDQVQSMARAGTFLAAMGGLPLPHFEQTTQDSKSCVLDTSVKVHV